MNTHDEAPTAPPKRTYQTPEVIELGDVRELTRGSKHSVFDGPTKGATKV